MHPNGSLRRRRRVAHITLGLDTGGQEKLLLEFARSADRRRFELFFLSLTTRGRLGAEIEACGWPVIALDERPGFRPSIALHALPWLRKWGIDVVHTHDSKPLIYGAPAARMAGAARVVHTRHFARLAQFSGRQTWLAKVAARLVDDFVCVSQESARAALEEGVAARRVRTIWNGIDLKHFAFVGPNPAGPAVLVARLSPEKDVATLLRAVAQVAKAQPQFRLEIAGNGPCMSELRQLAKELEIDSKVTFLGELRDVAGLLARARLFVLPSLSEGVSLTLLEAMARGLPVVTTRVGGNPEVVLDGKTGVLVPAGNAPALAQALLDIQGDLAVSQELGRAGRKRVEQHFAAPR
ncbi:MAG TPA: glycosyltransferase, partial [Gemmataceae bacterium]|nr:glycosyltransferase [Gemmataceae bacterium]